MQDITVTIKAVDLVMLIQRAEKAEFDLDYRDRRIQRLENEINNLYKRLEDKHNNQKENEK